MAEIPELLFHQSENMSMDESSSHHNMGISKETNPQKAYEEVCIILRQNKDLFSRNDFRLETGKKYHKQALRHNIDCDLFKNLQEKQPKIEVAHR